MQVKAREIIDHEPTKKEMDAARWKVAWELAHFIAMKGTYKVTHAARRGTDKRSETHVVEITIDVPHEWEGIPNLVVPPPATVSFKPTEAAHEERTLQGLRNGSIPVPCHGRLVIEIQAEDLE